jgi:hypothetical protein
MLVRGVQVSPDGSDMVVCKLRHWYVHAAAIARVSRRASLLAAAALLLVALRSRRSLLTVAAVTAVAAVARVAHCLLSLLSLLSLPSLLSLHVLTRVLCRSVEVSASDLEHVKKEVLTLP